MIGVFLFLCFSSGGFFKDTVFLAVFLIGEVVYFPAFLGQVVKLVL